MKPTEEETSDWEPARDFRSDSALNSVASGASEDRRSHRGMREILTIWLVGLLCAIVTLAFMALFLDNDVERLDKRFVDLKQLLDVVVGPIVTLLSTVIGFYFGSQAAERRDHTSQHSDQ